MNLPVDLKQYRNKQLWKKILFCTVSSLAVAVLFGFSYPAVSNRIGSANTVLLSLVFFAVPIVASKLVPALLDRDWKGEVLAVSVTTKPASYSDSGKTRICEKNTVFLLVKKENGKTLTLPVKTFVSKSEGGENVRIGREYHYHDLVTVGKPEDFVKRYRAGDRVYHFAGFKTNLVLSDGKNKTGTCVFCASENAPDAAVCHHCAHTLILP